MTQNNSTPTGLQRLGTLAGQINFRFLFLVVVPLVVLVIAGVIYLTGGRFEETENAYVHSDMVAVVPEVSGTITDVAVRENQAVSAGDRLFTIDPTRYRIAVAQARSALADVRTQIEAMKAQYEEQQQALDTARSDLAFAEREYQRQVQLSRSRAVSESALDSYRHKQELAQQSVQQAQKGLERIKAGLAGDPDIAVEEHPMYRKAQASLEAAEQDLADTEVTAPFNGIASKTPVVGQFAGPGRSAMSLVSTESVYIDANLKETQLTHVTVGQPVDVVVDTYPDRTFKGHVASIAAATGSEFSVLPAQNATGNWVKVVQRVPVRIDLDEQPEGVNLRSGMSSTVEIDTGHLRGPAFLAPLATWLQGKPETAGSEGAE